MAFSSKTDEFPKPTRPLNAPLTQDDQMNQFESSSHDEDHDETPKGEKEAVDELLSILVECLENQLSTKSRAFLLRKFFSEVEKEEELQKFIVERLKQSKVKTLTDLYERLPWQMGMDDDGGGGGGGGGEMRMSVVESAEQLSEKLGRFQIKTLDFGDQEEVKKDEDSQNKGTKSK